MHLELIVNSIYVEHMVHVNRMCDAWTTPPQTPSPFGSDFSGCEVLIVEDPLCGNIIQIDNETLEMKRWIGPVNYFDYSSFASRMSSPHSISVYPQDRESLGSFLV